MNRVYCPGPSAFMLAVDVLVLAADVLVLAADMLVLAPAHTPAPKAAHASLALIPLIALGNLPPPYRSANTSEASCTPARNASDSAKRCEPRSSRNRRRC
ncbi:hypothetical protein C8J57DRAFT_1508418 [Mycena rebaudengoi]|nr:hypothetical protein C8J57DRAFT_1508418 [Mycena rebaudengoi]